MANVTIIFMITAMRIRNDSKQHSYESNLAISEDWLNFLERMKREKELTELQLWEADEAIQLRLWASYRGQTLARTVRGMMYYQR